MESVSGLCAAILRTRAVKVNVTSTISSSVTWYPAAHCSHSYFSRRTVFNVALGSRTPPHPGQSTFQDSSNNPIRAACRNAAMTCSSLRLRFDAKSRTLIRQSLWSGASRTNDSIASVTSAFADCRRTLNIAWVSAASDCMAPSLRVCSATLLLLNRYSRLTEVVCTTPHRTTLMHERAVPEQEHSLFSWL